MKYWGYSGSKLYDTESYLVLLKVDFLKVHLKKYWKRNMNNNPACKELRPEIKTENRATDFVVIIRKMQNINQTCKHHESISCQSFLQGHILLAKRLD